jgi:omega-6 fatty acid desaturase (delta-12 desaturase)
VFGFFERFHSLTVSAKSWATRLAPYRQSDNARAAFELALTLALFVASWIVTYHALKVSGWLAAVLMIVSGGFLVRLFMLQHDCGHLSMFTTKSTNDWVGRALGVFTITPYDYWRHSHAMHHAGSGNLDRRGMGDIKTLTLAEYQALGFWGKIAYRAYRNPITLFVIGPVYVFVLNQRMPPDCIRQGRSSWMSVLFTNAAMLVCGAVLAYFIGWKMFLLVHFPIVAVAASIGVWLFYVQHQFDETHWESNPHWSHEHAALHGSSFYDLPKPLMWLTGNIGIHHLHHLSSRIPFYRLPHVLRDFPELRDVGRLTLWESFKCVKLVLWDEASKKLVSFREAHAMMSMKLMPAE